mgnify:CR=1 FL=1
MVIDTCMDHVPERLYDDEEMLNGFLNCISQESGYKAYVGSTAGGARQMILEKPEGLANLNYVDGEYSLKVKLDAMDECGVDAGIIKIPCWQEWLDIKTCRMVNDDAAVMCAESDGRLYALAAVPPWDEEENYKELERCVNELGMCGVQLACHYGERYLDDPIFRPFLSRVNEMKLPVYVRHTPLPADWKHIVDYNNVRRTLGRVVDQSIAVGRELFCGMFDELPDLRFVHTILGGNWYSVAASMIPARSSRAESMERLESDSREKILEYLDKNIFFEATHPSTLGKDQLESAVRICGADHILFGSSFPVFHGWMGDGVRMINSLDISEEEKQLILGGNAERVFLGQ